MQFLTADKNQHHVNACEELHQITSDDSTFMSRVITGDKSWIYGYDPRTKQQFSQWKSEVLSQSMLITFFDIKGIAHKVFVMAGQTVASAYYCSVFG
jgi:dTDP-4-dehydrorhamnose 3,5-epimerase-like enzyme